MKNLWKKNFACTISLILRYERYYRFMSFKKKKIIQKKEKKVSMILPYFFAFLGSIFVFFIWVSVLGYYSIDPIEKIQNVKENYKIKAKEKDEVEKKAQEEEAYNKEKTNILLVWRGGGNHTAPNLTDTIILASIHKDNQTVSLLSIPRDLYVDYPNGSSWKINGIYESVYGLEEDIDDGMNAIERKIEEITWEEIDYYVNVDFDGFMELIDNVGWVDVVIPETFVDNSYPDNNYGYTTFILRKWSWTLDWETALKYARSRHSTSDFDRSLRQQQIIQALREKMLSLNYLWNPLKIKGLYDTFQDNIQTDIPLTKLIGLDRKSVV